MIIEDRREFVNFKDCGPGCVFEYGDGGVFMKIDDTEDGINAILLENGNIYSFYDDLKVRPLNATLVIE